MGGGHEGYKSGTLIEARLRQNPPPNAIISRMMQGCSLLSICLNDWALGTKAGGALRISTLDRYPSLVTILSLKIWNNDVEPSLFHLF